jgi:pimeloyl-ACP methyl ester carboxylesterase
MARATAQLYATQVKLDLDTGVTLAFDRHGQPDSAPVVMLHGLSSNRSDYDDVVARLQGRLDRGEIQLIVVDLRGHGESGHAAPDAYEAKFYAADVAALLDLLGLGPAILVGHSLGGVVCSELATLRPDLVAALFLEDPPTFEGDAERRASSPAAQFFPIVVRSVRALRNAGASEAEYGELSMPGSTAEQIARRAWSLSRWDPATMEAAMSGTLWHDFDPLAVPSCPITVLRADPAVGAVFTDADAEAFSAAAPHARIHVVTGSDHLIHQSAHVDTYVAHLEECLDQAGRDQSG